MNWIALTSENQIEELIEQSQQQPVMVFKHSTRCSISTMAKGRLERNWNDVEGNVAAYYLDLLQYRHLSSAVADCFQVHHESPQFLLIKNGVCVYDASHSDVTVQEINDGLKEEV